MAGKSLSRPSNPSQRLNYSLLDLHTIVFISGEGVCRAIVNFDLQFLRPSTVMLSIRVYALWFQSRIVLIILLVTMTVRLKAISINPTSFTRVIRVVSSGHYRPHAVAASSAHTECCVHRSAFCEDLAQQDRLNTFKEYTYTTKIDFKSVWKGFGIRRNYKNACRITHWRSRRYRNARDGEH